MADPTRLGKPDPLPRESVLAAERSDSATTELRRLDAALQRAIDEGRQRRQGEIGQLDRYDEALSEISHQIHQVNNPLTSLLGRAQILRLEKDLDPRVVKASAVIEDSAQRIADDVKAISRVVQSLREQTRKRRVVLGADGSTP